MNTIQKPESLMDEVVSARRAEEKGAAMTQMIPIKLLDPHPDNPRLKLREHVIAAIRAQLQANGGRFDPMHAIIVRHTGKRYQIIAGHHRVDAAQQEGIREIPAWVREMDDETAFMELILSNAQSELNYLERGRHALHATTKYGANGGMSIAKYAAATGGIERSVKNEMYAYEVSGELAVNGQLNGKMMHLVAIHAADPEHWPKLVTRMVEQSWSVAETQAEVKKLQPEKKPTPKPKPLIDAVTLTEWKAMEKAQQDDVMKWRERPYRAQYNEQKSSDIEWAQGSTNPVTGCLHNCPYCYARPIAERLYPKFGFEPVLHLSRLVAPYQTPLPPQAEMDVSYRNVFVCSIADLFGQWVPREWIEAVLTGVRDNPQWNFLFLTKFPIRMAEFEYPDNAWLGTTVDLQARVKNAERAMRKVKAKVKWLSLEPLIEPLQFDDLSTFQWVVIGGASAVKESSIGPSPAWMPPRHWVSALTVQAERAGCAVYHKTNLNLDRLRNFPGHIAAEPTEAPESFNYLKDAGPLKVIA